MFTKRSPSVTYKPASQGGPDVVLSPDDDLTARHGPMFVNLGGGRFKLVSGQFIRREEPLAETPVNTTIGPIVVQKGQEPSKATPVPPPSPEVALAALEGFYGKLEDQSVKKLKEIAEAEEIPLGDAKSKEEIVAAIRAAKTVT